MAIVGKRIDAAIHHLIDNDFENALIQISVAIDSTAKKKWKKMKPGKRIRLFIRDYEAFIYQMASSGGLTIYKGAKLIIQGKELPEIYYKLIRCVLLHGDDIKKHITFVDTANVIGAKDGKIIINNGHVFGFLYSVIIDPVNAGEFCESNPMAIINNKTVRVNELWGQADNFRKVCPLVI